MSDAWSRKKEKERLAGLYSKTNCEKAYKDNE